MNNGYFKEVGSPLGNARLPGVVVLGGAPPEPPPVQQPVVEPAVEHKPVQQDVVLNLNRGIATIGPLEDPISYLKNLRLFLIAQLTCVEDAIKSYGAKRLKEHQNEDKDLPFGEEHRKGEP